MPRTLADDLEDRQAMIAVVHTFEASIQAFANLAAAVTVVSGLLAWLAIVARLPSGQVGDAAGAGAGMGFAPGVLIAIVVYVHVAKYGLSG